VTAGAYSQHTIYRAPHGTGSAGRLHVMQLQGLHTAAAAAAAVLQSESFAASPAVNTSRGLSSLVSNSILMTKLASRLRKLNTD